MEMGATQHVKLVISIASRASWTRRTTKRCAFAESHQHCGLLSNRVSPTAIIHGRTRQRGPYVRAWRALRLRRTVSHPVLFLRRDFDVIFEQTTLCRRFAFSPVAEHRRVTRAEREHYAQRNYESSASQRSARRSFPARSASILRTRARASGRWSRSNCSVRSRRSFCSGCWTAGSPRSSFPGNALRFCSASAGSCWFPA